jgi:Fe-S-cluster containining protein
MKFPCVKCGLCCRLIQSIPNLAGYDSGGGVCRYLLGSLCAIYENRPQICNVEEMYAAHFEADMTEDQFVKMNLESCEKIAILFNDENALQRIREVTR